VDLDCLYQGFGFIISAGSKHDIVKHPNYPALRTTLPRHAFLAKGYVETAIDLIDRLLELEAKSGSGTSKESE